MGSGVILEWEQQGPQAGLLGHSPLQGSPNPSPARQFHPPNLRLQSPVPAGFTRRRELSWSAGLRCLVMSKECPWDQLLCQRASARLDKRRTALGDSTDAENEGFPELRWGGQACIHHISRWTQIVLEGYGDCGEVGLTNRGHPQRD